VQKMAQYASFCLIMGPIRGEVSVFARLWPVRVRVSFITGAVWSAILATAGLLVLMFNVVVGILTSPVYFAFPRFTRFRDRQTHRRMDRQIHVLNQY